MGNQRERHLLSLNRQRSPLAPLMVTIKQRRQFRMSQLESHQITETPDPKCWRGRQRAARRLEPGIVRVSRISATFSRDEYGSQIRCRHCNTLDCPVSMQTSGTRQFPCMWAVATRTPSLRHPLHAQPAVQLNRRCPHAPGGQASRNRVQLGRCAAAAPESTSLDPFAGYGAPTPSRSPNGVWGSRMDRVGHVVGTPDF